MAKYLLIIKLHGLQAYRIVKEAGFLLVALALVLILGVLLSGILSLAESRTFGTGLLVGLLPLGIHFNRKDLDFLKSLDYQLPLLLLLEYFLVALPIFLLFLAYGNYPAIMGLAVILPILVFLPGGNRLHFSNTKVAFLSWIPLAFFEIRLGFRSRLSAILLLGLLGLATPWLLGLLPVLVFFFSVIVVSFYDFFEPKEHLEQQLGKYFLLRKIGTNLAFIYLLLAFYFILFLIFHWQYWYFILIMMVYLALWISFAILCKYATYSPYRPKSNGTTIVSIFGIMALIPYLLPVNVLFLIWYAYKAQKNLRFNAIHYAGNK